ncbi:MAG: phosphoglucosamine mutase [Saprospiraceae bacterium]|nr:phosphoglucosamine mutase [Saprospiraceae bacterium]
MALKKTISGFRGTIGNQPGENLTPIDIVQFTSAYCSWLIETGRAKKIIIGRDARISGDMVNKLVTATAMGMGIDIVDLGLSTTPTVEMAVPMAEAGGGIILTASHNPKEWNALKLLNEKGEFISAKDAQRVLDLVDAGSYSFAEVNHLGSYTTDDTYLEKHIEAILEIPLVDKAVIEAANFKVLVDAVNSSGGIAVPAMLRALGVTDIIELNCEPTGQFAHNPEPLPANLSQASSTIKKENADLGIVVDPDVDRLAFINEDGTMFGEEYTLVAVADYILQNHPGNTVSNLSSTIALRQVTEKYNGEYHSAAVGEVNVVEKMKAVNAVIGGEGNGGVIYPALHYGRDALVGIALFLTHLAKANMPISHLRGQYPKLHISKNKINLEKGMDVNVFIEGVSEKYKVREQNHEDGLKIYFDDSDWVHLRESNTEPIIRIYSESTTEVAANNLADKIKADIREIMQEKGMV